MCLDWLNANKEHNQFDVEVLNYPTSELYVSPDDPVACMPVHAALMLESVGFGTEEANKKLVAVIDMLNLAIERARSLGIKEIVYLSSDERTDEYAVKVLGFRAIKAFRKVIP